MQGEYISSLQNNGIKNVVKLQQKSAERKSQNLIVVEGHREVYLALQSGIRVQAAYYCENFFTQQQDYSLYINNIQGFPIHHVTPEVYNKMAYRQNAEGILLLAKPPQCNLPQLKLSDNPLIIILESVEKPGNLGAILRTADAVHADAVIVCDPQTDIYNPNVIRSSLGCVFSNQLASCSSTEALAWLREKEIKSVAALVQANTNYYDTDLSIPLALVFGTEADGLSSQWEDNTDFAVRIPMLGMIDSLNVSVSVAILVYEALRQRIR